MDYFCEDVPRSPESGAHESGEVMPMKEEISEMTEQERSSVSSPLCLEGKEQKEGSAEAEEVSAEKTEDFEQEKPVEPLSPLLSAGPSVKEVKGTVELDHAEEEEISLDVKQESLALEPIQEDEEATVEMEPSASEKVDIPPSKEGEESADLEVSPSFFFFVQGFVQEGTSILREWDEAIYRWGRWKARRWTSI